MNKEEAISALSKSLKDITDKELVGILEIPETFFPSNPFHYTTKQLLEEKQRRANAAKLTYEEVLKEAIDLSLVRWLVSMGPRIHPELDLLGLDDIYEYVKKRQPIVRKKITTYKQENNIK